MNLIKRHQEPYFKRGKMKKKHKFYFSISFSTERNFIIKTTSCVSKCRYVSSGVGWWSGGHLVVAGSLNSNL